ncbi:DsbA family protein [Caldibacillus lycopersici]|uniref:ClpXP adapter protein SpxH n=1 Tax=Perspicuibacillus lycopersici TaxID=1325689 RepID=A0AAE3LS75_9BACI|nr:ClpXP adapter SpxH family protein [Perspicuibacillus lycopersici]MCU9612433.1 DsbA family protein [Perspicuibacillus lycopersici]
MIDKNKYKVKFSKFANNENKPLELYLFIDPLCTDCWSLEPIIKKLQIEFGHYFTLTYVLAGKLTRLNQLTTKTRNCKSTSKSTDKTISRECIDCNDILTEVNLSSPFLASISIKAAELQGRRAGVRFLRKLQEYLFFKNMNITEVHTLINCAKEADLDVEEFIKDIHSVSTSHAFQCDLKITNEMDVTEIPTIVFFNNNVEEAGIKVAGVNPYEIYIEIMSEILGKKPLKHPLPPLLSFIQHYHFLTTDEIAFVYNWSPLQVEMEMKKLMLRQEVDKIKSSYGTFWCFTGNNM